MKPLSRPHTLYIPDDLWEKAAQQASASGSSIASVITTSLQFHLGTQAEHLAVAPSHRPVMEDHVFTASVASGSTTTGRPPLTVTYTPQAQRDQLLNKINKGK